MSQPASSPCSEVPRHGGRKDDDAAGAGHLDRLPSTDLISHVLGFCFISRSGVAAPTTVSALRRVSRRWSCAFGQYLELHVVPRSSETDNAGHAVWTPDSNAELLLVLLHLDDGITHTLRTAVLHELRLVRRPPLALLQGFVAPRPLTAVRRLQIKCYVCGQGPELSTEHLTAMLEWAPNVTSLDVEGAEYITAVRRAGAPLSLRSLQLVGTRVSPNGLTALSPNLQELQLYDAPSFASDGAVHTLASCFPALRALCIPWASTMTSATIRSLQQLRFLRSIALQQCDASMADEFVQELCLGLKDLTALTLDVRLRRMPDTLAALRGLQELDVSGRELEPFRRMSALPKPHLGHNQLALLPPSFGKLASLMMFDLQRSRLISLPESFGGLATVTTLRLGCNSLQSLPETFGALSALSSVELRCNQLKTLPESFGGLTKLWHLDLCGNRLQSLPESIGGLKALTTLLLCANGLVFLPDSFGGLSALTFLDLRYNRLESLPESFRGLTSLTALHLRNNRFASVPDQLRGLALMKEVDFGGNPCCPASSACINDA